MQATALALSLNFLLSLTGKRDWTAGPIWNSYPILQPYTKLVSNGMGRLKQK